MKYICAEKLEACAFVAVRVYLTRIASPNLALLTPAVSLQKRISIRIRILHSTDSVFIIADWQSSLSPFSIFVKYPPNPVQNQRMQTALLTLFT